MDEKWLLWREVQKLDFSQSSLWWSAFAIIFNPIFWNIAARSEYRHRSLSQLAFGNSKLACYTLAACIFLLGLYRDYLFKGYYQVSLTDDRFSMAIKDQPSTPLIGPWISTFLGPILIIIGNIFVFASIYQLGILGTYLGDYFGFVLKKKATAFPYNVGDHPMYEGATMIFLGYALWYTFTRS